MSAVLSIVIMTDRRLAQINSHSHRRGFGRGLGSVVDGDHAMPPDNTLIPLRSDALCIYQQPQSNRDIMQIVSVHVSVSKPDLYR